MKSIYFDPVEFGGCGESQEHVIVSIAPFRQFDTIEKFHKSSNFDLVHYGNLWLPNEIKEFADVSLTELVLIDHVKDLLSDLSGIELGSDKKVLFFEAHDYMYNDFLFTHSNSYHRFIWQSGHRKYKFIKDHFDHKKRGLHWTRKETRVVYKSVMLTKVALWNFT